MSAPDLTTLTRDFGDVHGEARACRTRCALFDFSFMSRARLSGAKAVEVLSRYQPRPLGTLLPGRICYALRVSARGHVEADLTIWNLGADRYEVMSGRRVDITALQALGATDTRVEDLSDRTRIFAVQGPHALGAMAGLVDTESLQGLDYFAHAKLEVGGVPCRVGRLGYTGEKGFELVVDASDGPRLWSVLAERMPSAGFGAADCLRIEAGFILFANECRVGPTAVELGLGRFAGVSGRPPRQRLVCFAAANDMTPVVWQPLRSALALPEPGTITITSACRSVVTGRVLGLGFVVPHDQRQGRVLRDGSGVFEDVTLVSLPAYDTAKSRVRGPWGREAG